MARTLSAREGKLLAALVAAVAVWAWFSGRGRLDRPGASPASAREEGKAQSLGDPPVVRLDLLARRSPDYDPAGRDLFKYAPRPPSPVEIRRMREEEERRRREAEEAARRAAEEAARRAAEEAARQAELARNPPPPPPPQPPPIPLKFIGVIGPRKDKVAVFETGKDLLLAKKGETVQGEFRVVDIKFESVVVGYTRKEFQHLTRELPMVRGGR